MDSLTRNQKSAAIFSEDVVVNANNNSVIGYVSRVAGESDSEDDGDELEGRQVQDGHARVRWLNFPAETTEKLTSLVVIDRAFLHGNIVTKASDPLGQTGMVISVEMKADLQHPSGKKMLGVDTKILRQPRDIIHGRYVVKGIWLGRVENVVDDVTVVFDDGSKCKCERVNPEHLLPVRETATDIDAECMYYPGQRVRASNSRFFRGAKWLKGSWQSSYHEATVLEVEAGTVSVFWMCTGSGASVDEQSSDTAPPNDVEGKELILLDRFCHTSWQVGDYTLPPPGWLDEVQKGEEGTEGEGGGGDRSTCGAGEVEGEGGGGGVKEAPASQPMPVCINSGCSGSHGNGRCATSGETGGYGQRRRRKKSDVTMRRRVGRKDENWEYALQVVRTRTKVDVLWQDGTVDRDINTCDLFHVPHVGDHDFWPEEYVVERSQEVGVEENDGGQKRKLGIVRSVNAKQRTAVVQWLEPLSADKSEGYKKVGEEERVSVYELAADDDYTYILGEVVIRLPQSSDKKEPVPVPASVSMMSEDYKESVLLSSSNDCKEEAGRSDSVGQPSVEFRNGDDVPGKICESGNSVERKDLWWVGEVTGLEDGQVEVAWADGTTSKVGPQSLYVISRDDDSDDDDDGDSDGASWETVSDSGDEPESVDPVSMFRRNEPLREKHEKGQEEAAGQPGKPESHTPVVNEETAGKPANGTARGALALPRAAIGLVSRIAAGLFPFRVPDRREEIPGLSGENERLSAAKDSLPKGYDSSKSTLSSNASRRDALEKPSPDAGNVLIKRVTESDKSSPDTVQVDRSGFDQTEDNVEGKTGMDCSEGTDSDYRNVPSSAVSSEGQSTPSRASGSEMEEESGTALNDEVMEICPSEQEACAEFPEHVNGHGEAMVNLGFKRFECVKDCSDHHYFAESGQATSRNWAKAVQQEWSMLQKGLPDSIWVRVYEERMDLLRVAMAGAPGTPYHDNLFLFDLWLQPDFPNVPPVAYYHSWGFRLNPNLYESGKVCLSLLNTWSGRDTEMWHPGSSTLLQVLVSIQGLVLVPKPYFNEAGFDRQIGTGEGEKNSIDYNESAFLLSCKSMLQLIRRPPKHFENLIYAHFRSRGPHILAACEAYINGARVGSLGREGERKLDGETGENSFEGLEGEIERQGSSEGFKLMLGKIVPKLEEECKKLRLKKEVK